MTGRASQKAGVIPDMVIPDIFDGLTYREKDMPAALIEDTVKRNSYYKPLNPLPVSIIGVNSIQRINNDKNFKQILALQKIITEESSHSTPVSLKWDEIEKQLKEDVPKEMQKPGEQEMKVSSYKAENHAYDKKRIGNDEFFSLVNSRWLQKLEQDFILEESFRILIDYISITNIKN